MAVTLDDKLVVAISSRALFDFEEENTVFECSDPDTYLRLQRERLDTPAAPGVAFSLVQKLLAFNAEAPQRVEVVLLSRNDPVSGMRVFRSAKAHGLDSIQRGVFTQGRDPFGYLRPLGAQLFLSANADDVTQALQLATRQPMCSPTPCAPAARTRRRYALPSTGMPCCFPTRPSVYQSQGLEAFQKHELEKPPSPCPKGRSPLLAALHRLQQMQVPGMRIRTALVTARSAPAHERALNTLMDWKIDVDEAMFLGGLAKGAFLREFEPDFFFDDQTGHVRNAASHVPSGHAQRHRPREGAETSLGLTSTRMQQEPPP